AVFNEILEILGLPGKGDEGATREPGLGQMSELLTAFDHVVRRAAPDALYRVADGASADEGAEDAMLAADREERAPRLVLGASRGEIYLMRLRAFLEEFAGRAAEEVPAHWEDNAGAVQVLTIHQSKGLEFPIVFVPSLVEGRLPSSRLGQPQEWYLPDALFDRTRYEG